MPASNAIAANNTLLKRGAGDTVPGPETFVDVAELQSLNIDISMDTQEVTHMTSPNNWKEFIPTNKSMTVRAGIQFVPTDNTQDFTAGLGSDLKARAKKNFKVVFPDGTTWTFSAYVTNFSTDPKFDDALRADVTFQVTGEPTLA